MPPAHCYATAFVGRAFQTPHAATRALPPPPTAGPATLPAPAQARHRTTAFAALGLPPLLHMHSAPRVPRCAVLPAAQLLLPPRRARIWRCGFRVVCRTAHCGTLRLLSACLYCLRLSTRFTTAACPAVTPPRRTGMRNTDVCGLFFSRAKHTLLRAACAALRDARITPARNAGFLWRTA